MKREEKAAIMNNWVVSPNINKAKYLIASVADYLESSGMEKQADIFMKIVYELEHQQNKYK